MCIQNIPFSFINDVSTAKKFTEQHRKIKMNNANILQRLSSQSKLKVNFNNRIVHLMYADEATM